VALFAMAKMQTVAMSSGSIAHKITVANALGREAMEDILSWDPAAASLNTSVSNVAYANNVSLAGAGTFNITYTTTVNTPAVGTTRVDITVTGNGVQPVVLIGYKKVV